MDSKFLHNPQWNGKISWTNTSFVVITPLLTLLLLPYMIFYYGLHWSDFVAWSIMIFTTGVSITVGYHRLFSHQTFDAHPIVRGLLLFFGAGCIENSALKWSSDHRYHHRFVDKEGDPYNINRGFFYAHMGWIFFRDPPGRTLDNAPDLKKDWMVQFQPDHYPFLSMFVGFVIPTLIGWAFGRPLAGFFWGGLFRVVFLHHMSFLTNSACHTFGSRPYSTKVTARDCWWLSFLTNGESYHNFHHAFGSDYRNGVRWYHWDPSKWFIRALEMVGLASNLTRTPDAIILKARLETSYADFRSSWTDEIPEPLEQMRASLDAKLQEFQLKLREFQTWKENKAAEHARFRRTRARYWKRRLRGERLALEASIAEFRQILRSMEMHGTLPSFG